MLPKPLLRLLLGCCLSTGLAGCSHVPVTSMIKLARVDFETSDPAQLRAAIKLPRSLRMRPNGVTLRIAARIGRAPEEARDFVLRESLAAPDELAQETDASSHILAYRVDDADVTRLAAFRAELMAKKNSGQRGSLSITVQPKACRIAELAEGPVYFTTYLRTAETETYVVLARAVDLRTMVPGRSVADEIPRCGS